MSSMRTVGSSPLSTRSTIRDVIPRRRHCHDLREDRRNQVLQFLWARRLYLTQRIQHIVALARKHGRQDLDGLGEELGSGALRETLVDFFQPLGIQVEGQQDGVLACLAVVVEMRLPSVDHQGAMGGHRVFLVAYAEPNICTANLENDVALAMGMKNHRMVEPQEGNATERPVNDAQGV